MSQPGSVWPQVMHSACFVSGFHRGLGVGEVGLLLPCVQGAPPGPSTGLSPAPLPDPPEPGGMRLCPFSLLEMGTAPGARQPRHKPELWPCRGLGCTGLPARRASGAWPSRRARRPLRALDWPVLLLFA